ncbi:nuclear transport factor 2 family protein [Pseudooceanicola nitratireducens]|uniref:nuclear transport factor 2 family protein n=1 Tax=Pseudooceanicola nitratireducens TaxID=517719 RepID=UPI00333F33CB
MAGAQAVMASRPGDTASGNALAQDIALALLGAGTVDPSTFAADAQWQRPDGVLTGRAQITNALTALTPPASITVEQVVSQGRTASVSGRVRLSPSDARLFCIVLRFTSAACRDLAQIVSFDHRLPR